MTGGQVLACALCVGVLCLMARGVGWCSGRVALLAWLVLSPLAMLMVWFTMVWDEVDGG